MSRRQVIRTVTGTLVLISWVLLVALIAKRFLHPEIAPLFSAVNGSLSGLLFAHNLDRIGGFR